MSGFALKNPKSERLFELLRCAERESVDASASPVPVLLAPMAGITDSAFRRLCIEQGCDFTFTEMVSANGLHYKNRKTQELISISEAEKPCGVQLFGHDPEIIAETVERLFEGLVSKSEVQAAEIDELVERTFEGSVPAFIAAFTKRKDLGKDELAKIREMLDSYTED